MKRLVAALVLAAAAASASCNDPVAPPSPIPAEADTTEVFTGTLDLVGSNVHPFVVKNVGRLRVTLTLPPGVNVVLAVGTPLGAACQPVEIKLSAETSTTPQINGTATINGVFCVSVTDANRSLTEPVEYSLRVEHS